MLNYQDNPRFSWQRSQTRISRANRVLGTHVVSRILAFALYLLGANRVSLAHFVNMPPDTLKSLLRRVLTEGLPSLEDRRHKASTFLPPIPVSPSKPRLIVTPDTVTVALDDQGLEMELPRRNKLQCRTVLLTMVAGNVLGREEVSDALSLSSDRIRKLKSTLLEHDVHGLIDQRKGHQHDYRVTPEMKAELVQQYVLNLVTETPVSSQQLSDDLEKRCEVAVPPRTICLHVRKLGLQRIRASLPRLLAGCKKNSKN